MIVIVSRYLIPKGFRGITLFPFIIISKSDFKPNSVVINHEKIHIRQQLELLILPFFIWYGIEFLIKYMIFKDKHTAYRNISFEREAYENEKDFNYLKKRSFWRFFEYMYWAKGQYYFSLKKMTNCILIVTFVINIFYIFVN